MRPRGSFRVVLDRKDGEVPVAHAFQTLVIQVDMGDLHLSRRERIHIDAESVVLCGNFNFLGGQVLHGMIRAVMTELKFEGFAAKSETAELMAEADAKDGHAAEELLDVFDSVADWLRIAWTIREEDAVRLEIHNVLGRRLRRDNPHIAVVIDEQPQYILLDAKIIGRHAKFAGIRNSS